MEPFKIRELTDAEANLVAGSAGGADFSQVTGKVTSTEQVSAGAYMYVHYTKEL